MNEYYRDKYEQIKTDKYQWEALNSTKSTVVIAGPGSGKTTILTLKVMELLEKYISKPRGLACITYSREAAREFKDRLALCGYSPRNNVFLGTVHSFCIAEILIPFADAFKQYNIPLPINIISEKEKKEIYKQSLAELMIPEKQLTVEEMDKERSTHIQGESKVVIEYYDIAARVAERYEKLLHESGKMDFIDIVKYSTELIQKEEYVRNCLESKFPWLVIDEYQDLGRPLHEMILALIKGTKIRIFAVGDPDQSIYEFQGARPEYLEELRTIEGIKDIRLIHNYRSSQQIVEASQKVLGIERGYLAKGTTKDIKAEFKFVKCHMDIESQYRAACYYIKNMQQMGVQLHEIAVLLKTGGQIKQLSEIMEQEGIPFYISKYKFKNTECVKWLQKCATWVIDNSLIEFNDIFGFYKETLEESGEHIDTKNEIVFKRQFMKILDESKEDISCISKWAENICKKSNLLALLKESIRYTGEEENIVILMEELRNNPFKKMSLLDFSNFSSPKDQVVLSTRHSSKGLEFESVILLGMEEGSFPDFRSYGYKLQEEYRICFVCVSRAKKNCILIRSQYLNITPSWCKACEPSVFWKVLMKQSGGHEEIYKE